MADQVGEWFELYNAGAEAVNLIGCVIESSNDQPHTISGTNAVIIPAGAHAAFGRSGDLAENGGVAVVYAYSGLDLLNGADSISLSCDGQVIDALEFGGAGWPTGSGAALQLDLSAIGSSDTHAAGSWCLARTVYGDGDQGTPGTTNVYCGTACDGVVCDAPPVASCDGGAALTWVSEGTCLEGICSYELAESTTCNANQICKQGECILQGSATPPPPPGSMVITEIMHNPAAVPDDQGEWFEVESVAGAAFDLTGCRLESTNDDGYTIDPGAEWLIQPGQRVIFGALGDVSLNGGLSVDHVYGAGVRLANSSDTLTVRCAGLVVDEVSWDDGATFPDDPGAAMQLHAVPSSSANDTGTNWCSATTSYGDGDLGTPGAANGSCEAPDDPGPDDPGTNAGYPVPGEVTITELMANPAAVSDTKGEWFELTHTDGGAHDLQGCVLATVSASHVVDGGDALVIAPGAILVFARDGDVSVNGGLTADYDYAALNLTNSDGTLSLRCGETVVTSFTWCGSSAGASQQLSPDGQWCETDPGTTYGAGDAGSPGLSNPPCPAPPEPLGDPPVAGEVIVTEVMQNPAAVGDSAGEWFELTNLAAIDLDLTGCTIGGTNDSDHIIQSLGIAAGSHVVISRDANAAANGGVNAHYAYSGLTLGNGADGISLSCAGILIDAMAWDDGATFPDPNGASMQLAPGSHSAAANDAGANWCAASSPFGAGDLGTPGAPNDSCP